MIVIVYSLTATTRRLTFDIQWQHQNVTFMGSDESGGIKFLASNGYEVISRSRMDIQTERMWVLGAKSDEPRSGSMVFATNLKRDWAKERFHVALSEWARSVSQSGEALCVPAGYEWHLTPDTAPLNGPPIALLLGNGDVLRGRIRTSGGWINPLGVSSHDLNHHQVEIVAWAFEEES
jgi:hypothetical protein